MTRWENIKADPLKLQKHKENSKNHAKKKYDEDPLYKEYMRNKARIRKAMLKLEK